MALDSDGSEAMEEIKEAVRWAVEAGEKKKRVLIAAGAVVVLLVLASFALLFLPGLLSTLGASCENGVLDVGEEGIDCGGVCFKQDKPGGEKLWLPVALECHACGG
jgi:hypothetical protein